jgi:excinuclease ABC subunit B
MSQLDYYGPGRGRSRIDEVAEADLPIPRQIERLEKEMKQAAKDLEFEEAAALRDKIRELQELQIYSG